MNKQFLLIYFLIVASIVTALLVFANQMNDMTEMLLFALIIVITSFFSYATRRKK